MKELLTAFAKAQAEMKPAVKDATNPHFGQKYADLASVIEAIRTPFANHGLAFTQEQQYSVESGKWLLVTKVWLGDQCIYSTTPILPKGLTAQDFGAALTYARRQGLQSLAGVAADIDDDGNLASGITTKPSIKTKPEPVKTEVKKPDNRSAERDIIINLAKANGYTIAEVAEFLTARFNKKLVTDLNADEFKLLSDYITTKTMKIKEPDNDPSSFSNFNTSTPRTLTAEEEHA